MSLLQMDRHCLTSILEYLSTPEATRVLSIAVGRGSTLGNRFTPELRVVHKYDKREYDARTNETFPPFAVIESIFNGRPAPLEGLLKIAHVEWSDNTGVAYEWTWDQLLTDLFGAMNDSMVRSYLERGSESDLVVLLSCACDYDRLDILDLASHSAVSVSIVESVIHHVRCPTAESVRALLDLTVTYNGVVLAITRLTRDAADVFIGRAFRTINAIPRAVQYAAKIGLQSVIANVVRYGVRHHLRPLANAYYYVPNNCSTVINSRDGQSVLSLCIRS